MSVFDDFLATVKSGVTDLAKGTLKEFVGRAEADFEAFKQRAVADWQRWTTMLANKELTQQEFEGLLKGQAALAEMHALTEAGLAATRVQRFRDAVIKLVIDSAFKTFLKI